MADAAATLNSLPASYQTRLDQIALRKQLAQSLSKQGMQVQQGQMVGGRYIAPGGLGYANQLAQALGGAWLTKNAVQDQGKAQEDYQAGLQGDLKKVRDLQNAGDLQGAISVASGSEFSPVQKMADALVKQQESRSKIGADASAPGAAVKYAQTGNLQDLNPGQNSDVKAALDPTTQKPVGYYMEDRKGQPHFVPQTGTVINMGPKAGEAILQKQVEGLQTQLPEMQKTAQSIPKLVDAYQTLTSLPLNNGLFADEKTALQKFGALVGIDVPDNAPNTEYYKSQIQPLIGGVLHATTGSQQVSNADAKAANTALPNIFQDPRAAQAVLGTLLKGSVRTIEQHNTQVQKTQDNAPQMEGFNPKQLDSYKVDWQAGGNDPNVQALFQQIATGTPFKPSATPAALAQPAASTAPANIKRIDFNNSPLKSLFGGGE